LSLTARVAEIGVIEPLPSVPGALALQ